MGSFVSSHFLLEIFCCNIEGNTYLQEKVKIGRKHIPGRLEASFSFWGRKSGGVSGAPTDEHKSSDEGTSKKGPDVALPIVDHPAFLKDHQVHVVGVLHAEGHPGGIPITAAECPPLAGHPEVGHAGSSLSTLPRCPKSKRQQDDLGPKAKVCKYVQWNKGDAATVMEYFDSYIRGTSPRTLPSREELEAFKQSSGVPHELVTIKTKVFNEKERGRGVKQSKVIPWVLNNSIVGLVTPTSVMPIAYIHQSMKSFTPYVHLYIQIMTKIS